MTLAEAAKHLPKVDGKKVAVATLWRWCRRGLPTPAQERTRRACVASGFAALPLGLDRGVPGERGLNGTLLMHGSYPSPGQYSVGLSQGPLRPPHGAHNHAGGRPDVGVAAWTEILCSTRMIAVDYRQSGRSTCSRPTGPSGSGVLCLSPIQSGRSR